jgi:hypothetical protein
MNIMMPLWIVLVPVDFTGLGIGRSPE